MVEEGKVKGEVLTRAAHNVTTCKRTETHSVRFSLVREVILQAVRYGTQADAVTSMPLIRSGRCSRIRPTSNFVNKCDIKDDKVIAQW